MSGVGKLFGFRTRAFDDSRSLLLNCVDDLIVRIFQLSSEFLRFINSFVDDFSQFGHGAPFVPGIMRICANPSVAPVHWTTSSYHGRS